MQNKAQFERFLTIFNIRPHLWGQTPIFRKKNVMRSWKGHRLRLAEGGKSHV